MVDNNKISIFKRGNRTFLACIVAGLVSDYLNLLDLNILVFMFWLLFWQANVYLSYYPCVWIKTFTGIIILRINVEYSVWHDNHQKQAYSFLFNRILSTISCRNPSLIFYYVSNKYKNEYQVMWLYFFECRTTFYISMNIFP